MAPEILKRKASGMSSIIAVDWSGARKGAQNKIWLSKVTGEDGTLGRIENGRTRTQLVTHLIELAEEDPDLIVGLDFAFSMPAWFIEDRDITDVRRVWDLVENEGEKWLKECPPPFYGKPGKKKPEILADKKAFRHTELEVSSVPAVNAKSVFQIGGAGAVGTGSIRGMPFLKRLSEAGFSIWPFDPPDPPVVLEIYPRVLSGAVTKSDPADRLAKLKEVASDQEHHKLILGASNEDAFDATVSALVMSHHAREILDLGRADNEPEILEGLIWHPGLYDG